MPNLLHPDQSRCRPLVLVSLVALLLTTLLASTASVADPGDLLTDFGTGGFYTESQGTDHFSADVLLHPDLGLVVAIWDPVNVAGQVRILRLDPRTGAALQSVTLPTVLEIWDLRLADDGFGGLVVGASIESSPDNWDLWITRLTADLSVDPGFGEKVIAFDRVAGGDEFLEDLMTLPGGRTVALAQVETASSDIRPGVAFLLSDGSLDPTIQNGSLPSGLQIVDFAVSGHVIPEALAMDSQGRFTLAGNRWGADEMAFARLAADGTIDTTFGSQGTSLLEYRDCEIGCSPIPNVMLADLEILGDRAYAVVTVPGANSDVAIARLSELGGLDPFFPWRRLDFPAPAGSPSPGASMSEFLPGLEVDERRQGLVISLEALDQASGTEYLGIARFTTAGELDSSFGNGGKMSYSVDAAPFLEKSYLAVGGIDETEQRLGDLWVASAGSIGPEIVVMAVEGFDVSVFSDGFESGGLTAWSAHVP